MTGDVIWVLSVTIIVILALAAVAITYGNRVRRNEEYLDVIPLEFLPANRVVSGRVVPESERDTGASVRSERDMNCAHLVAALKNSGSRPLSVDEILVFDQHRTHKYAVLQKAHLQLGLGDSKTVQVEIPPLEGVRYVKPPEGSGRIEVITTTHRFCSDLFRFSDLA